MSVELNDEQVELVLRLAEPIKGQQREQFMQALGRILAEGPGNDYVIAAFALALDSIALPANADTVAGFKETQMT
jgi:hypothetical protein